MLHVVKGSRVGVLFLGLLLACQGGVVDDGAVEEAGGSGSSQGTGGADGQPVDNAPEAGQSGSSGSGGSVGAAGSGGDSRGGQAGSLGPSAGGAGQGGTSTNTGGSAVLPPPSGTIPMFVAIGRGGRRIMSCDKGRTWVANQFVSMQDGEHSTFTPKGLTYGNGTFIFLSGWGTASTTWISRDGVQWLEQKQRSGFAGLGYDDGQFVLVGDPHLGSMDDGKSWVQLTPPESNLGREAAAFKGVWTAGSDGQAQMLRKGTNAWVAIAGCTGSRHGGIGADGGFAASDKIVISVGDDGDVCGAVIATGAGIAASKLNGSVRGKPVYTSQGFMVATGDKVYVSQDGSNWTSRTLPKGTMMDFVNCHPGGNCVGLSNDGKSFYYSDDAAVTWQRGTGPSGMGFVAVAAGYGAPSQHCKAP